jgi:hypothetical protein
MTTDFRALCAELLEALEYEAGTASGDWAMLRVKADAALAQPEPLADGEVVELVAWLRANADYSLQKAATATFKRFHRVADLLERLAQPEPQGPTDEEILALSQWHEVSYTLSSGRVVYPLQEGSDMKDAVLSFTRAVLARWGRPAVKPVPVGERLPGPEDCDAEGRCWWGEPQIGDSHDATWNLCTQDEAEEYCTWGTKYGWLPAHALPIPTAND